MQKQRNERQQKTQGHNFLQQRAYSPEYSSPYSQQSILAARFDQASPKQGKPFDTKENFLDVPLPIFQDRESQMIPQVTQADSNSGCGGCGHVLSDMSDEQLIRQLQLSMNDKDKGSVHLATSHSSQAMRAPHIQGSQSYELSNPPQQPFQERTNQTVSAAVSVANSVAASVAASKESSVVLDQGRSSRNRQHQYIQHKALKNSKVPSPKRKPNFICGKVQQHTWQQPSQPSQSPVRAKKEKASAQQAAKNERRRKSTEVEDKSKSGKKSSFQPTSTQQSNVLESMIQCAPEPHPYPFQHELTRLEVTDKKSCVPTETQTTDQKQTSPAISQESTFKAVINTNSSKKFEQKFLQNSNTQGTSEAQHKSKPLEAYQGVSINQFAQHQNSTIQEQPTEEQLGASQTAAQIRQHQFASKNGIGPRRVSHGQFDSRWAQLPQQSQRLVPQPMIISEYTDGVNGEADDASAGQQESESLQQIRMINEGLQKNFPSNYSPKLDQSGSLQDFSMGIDATTNPNDQYNVVPLVDFEKDYNKALTGHASMSQVSLRQEAASNPYQRSARNPEMSQQAKMRAMLRTYDDRDGNQKNQQNESSLFVRSNNDKMKQPQQNEANINLAMIQPYVPVESQRNSLRPTASTRMPIQTKSPMQQQRNSIYGQCLVPSEQLYQPILRGSTASAKPKNDLAQSTSGLPTKLDFMPTSLRASRDLNRKASPVISKPSFQSPAETGVQAKRPRVEPRAPLRRNLEPQLSTAKTSQSPVSNNASPYGSNKRNTGALSTMLNRYAASKRTQSKEAAPQANRTQTNRLSRYEQKKSPSPIPVSRTRNEAINATRSLNLRQGELANLQTATSATSLKRQPEPVQQQTPSVMGMVRPSISNINQTRHSNANSKTADGAQNPSSRSPMTRASLATINATSQRRHSNLLDAQYQQQLTQTLNRPQLPVPTRASLYQMRRAIDGMRLLDIQMFLELERIKKPSAAVLAIARMSCVFFESLRQRDPIMMDSVESMHSWQQIQDYMKAELMCCVPELRTLIKQKIIAFSKLSEDENPKETDLRISIEKINETFFAEAKMRVIRRFIQTSKLMKQLVHLIYSVVCLILDLEREHNSYDNLLNVSELPSAKFDDVKQLLLQSMNANTLSGPPTLQNASPEPLNAPRMRSQKSRSRSNSRENSRNFSHEHQQQTRNIEISHHQSKVINVNDVDQSRHGEQSRFVDQSKSLCSKCSCEIRQNHSMNQHVSRIQSASQQRSSARVDSQGSVDRQEPQVFRGGSPANFEMHMQVFRTLDHMYQEHQSIASRQSKQSQSKKTTQNNSFSQSIRGVQPEQAIQDVVVGSGRITPDHNSHQNLSIKNYTTVQLPKPYQAKPRTSTPDDLLNVMSIMEEYQPKKQKRMKYEEGQANLPKNTENRSQRRQFSNYFSKQSSSQAQPLRQSVRNNRNASVSSGSDFVSVVRASAQISGKHSQRLTPNSKGATQRTDKTTTSQQQTTAGVSAAKRHSRKQTTTHNFNALTRREETSRPSRKDISPVTPKSQNTTRRLQKSTNGSSVNQISQKRIKTMSVQNQPHQAIHQPKTSHTVRHSRNTTLYKSTAAATAKIKQSGNGVRSSLQRESSSKTLQKPLGSSSTVNLNTYQVQSQQQTSVRQQNRKTKSQTNLKAQVGKRSTTPQSKTKDFTVTSTEELRNKRRQAAQRNLNALRNATPGNTDLEDFVATENAVQMQQVHEHSCKQLENDSQNRIDTVPSFGGDLIGMLPTEDYRYTIRNNQPSTIEEEESSVRPGTTRRTARAPLFDSNITPEKNFDFYIADNNIGQMPQTPLLQMMGSHPGRQSTQQETAQLGKQQQVEDQEVMFNDSLEEPPFTIEPLETDEDRQNFFMAKAQAITENINSCYKQHNMPKIDMATIQKLKMRRLQFMHQAVCEIDQRRLSTEASRVNTIPTEQFRNFSNRRGAGGRETTQQSCNVMTTMTVETTMPEEQDQQDFYETGADQYGQSSQHEISFTEALNKLRSEVESLMQRRIN